MPPTLDPAVLEALLAFLWSLVTLDPATWTANKHSIAPVNVSPGCLNVRFLCLGMCVVFFLFLFQRSK